MGVGEKKESSHLCFNGTYILRMGAEAERLELTLPPGAAGGLHADLHQDIFRGSFLPTVVGRDRELILVLFAVVQLLCVFNVAWQRRKVAMRTIFTCAVQD